MKTVEWEWKKSKILTAWVSTRGQNLHEVEVLRYCPPLLRVGQLELELLMQIIFLIRLEELLGATELQYTIE